MKIMILGAGIYQVPLIETAKKMGLYTIVVSIPGNYPGFEIADQVYYENTVDEEKILEIAKKERIKGIVTTGTDVCVKTIGRVCDAMGLNGLSYEASKVAVDKMLMKSRYEEFGVRTMMLTWNEENALASGWPGDPERGLTAKGKEAIRRMNELGMVLDVSHINDKGFWDILELSDGHPVIASHSNARAVSPHMRNLSDDMIRALAKTGGVMGMNRADGFIHPDKAKQTVEGLADHVDYIRDLVGIDHIGCGFDFEDYVDQAALSKNGIDNEDPAGTKGIESAAQAHNFLDVLESRGYTQEELEKVAYKNFYRVFKQVLR